VEGDPLVDVARFVAHDEADRAFHFGLRHYLELLLAFGVLPSIESNRRAAGKGTG
jgi:hypothetical protein